MMDKASQFFIYFIVLFAFLVFAAINFYRFWMMRQHTRERFAFFSVRIFVSFMLSAIVLLLARSQVLDFLTGFAQALGYKIDLGQPEDQIWTPLFILACGAMLWLMIYSVHRNWSGLPSTRQVNFQETGRTISLWQDHEYYRRHRSEIEIHQGKGKSAHEVFSPYEPDTRPWHIKAANLFPLLDQQYKIGEEEWYGEYQCYLSHYGQDNEKIAILCLEKIPTPERISGFVNYINSRQEKYARLIVAVTADGQQSFEPHNGANIEFRFESEMLDQLIPIGQYQAFIKKFFEGEKQDNSGLRLADMYVPLQGHTRKVEKGKLVKDQPTESVEEYVLNWAKGNRTHPTEHLVLLGNYGQGKTVLTHKIVQEMLEHPADYDRIPILIELRGLSPRNDDELSLFSRWANRFKAKSEALLELHRAGKLLIILDGFDEMDLVGDTQLLFNHFSQLWALARVPNSQLLIAGRPTLFADDEERRTALGIRDPRIDLPYARALYLDELTPPQTEQVLRNVQPETRTGILNALKSATPNSSFAELASRPSSLYQLSIVWDSELADKKDRLNSATVIGSFIEKTYDRQQEKEATVLTSFERNYFMMGIAVGMMLENGYTNQLKHIDLKRWVRKLWENYPPKLPPTGDAMQSRKSLEYLPIRLRENTDALDTILKDVRVGGILVQDLSGRDLFRFAHKSHLEYLVSAFYSGFLLQNEHDRPLLMMANAIAKTTQFSRAKLKTTPDVERFTAELIAAQIEVTDAQGSPLPIEGNEKKFSDALFDMLNPYDNFLLRNWANYFPKLTGWLTLHPDQKYFVGIGLLAIGCGCGAFLAPTETTKLVLVVINTLLCWCWAGLIFSYGKNKDRLLHPTPTPYFTSMKLYHHASNLLGCPDSRFSTNYKTFLRSEHGSSKFAVNALFSHYVLISGIIAFSSTVAGAFIVTFEQASTILIGLAVTFPVIISIGGVFGIANSFSHKVSSAIAFFFTLANGITAESILASAVFGAFSYSITFVIAFAFAISLVHEVLETVIITFSCSIMGTFYFLKIKKAYKKAFAEMESIADSGESSAGL